MATSKQELRDEISAVLIRYRRRISDRGGVVPEACIDELVAVAERHGSPSPLRLADRLTAEEYDELVAEWTAKFGSGAAPAAKPVPGPGRRQARRPTEPAEFPA